MEGGRTAPGAGRVPTARVRLARLARDAALRVAGVASVGPRLTADRSTLDDGERLEGVVSVAEPDGRYGVSLDLGAEPVPLHELADRVREAVGAAAERHGLGSELGRVDVVIDDVVEPGGGATPGAPAEPRDGRAGRPSSRAGRPSSGASR